MDIERIRKNIKIKSNSNSKSSANNAYVKNLLIRTLFATIITIAILVFCKISNKYKYFIKTNVYEKKISLAFMNDLYTKYLGSIIPFKDVKILKEEVSPVFNSNLEYKELSIYKDGINLTVDSNYLVPSFESGLVLYVGEKEGYGKCAVVEQISSVDIWYCNMSVTNVKVYDYIEKGTLIGEANKNLYLVYQKNGKSVNYKEYFKENKDK